MIQFENVTKSYPLGVTALDSVSFVIERNEFTFLVGTSGAGKTTILNLILGDLYPSTGTVIVNDIDISNKKCNKIEELRKHIGVVFQDFKILNDKDVFENIALGLYIQNLSLKKISFCFYVLIARGRAFTDAPSFSNHHHDSEVFFNILKVFLF